MQRVFTVSFRTETKRHSEITRFGCLTLCRYNIVHVSSVHPRSFKSLIHELFLGGKLSSRFQFRAFREGSTCLTVETDSPHGLLHVQEFTKLHPCRCEKTSFIAVVGKSFWTPLEFYSISNIEKRIK